MRGLGTLVNVVTILVGTGIGLLLRGRFPVQVRITVLDGLGIIVMLVGVASFLETSNAVFVVVAIVLGGVLGELVGIEERLEAFAERLRRLVERPGEVTPEQASYVERDPDELALDQVAGDLPRERAFIDGFVVASLTFCVGALMIVGSIQEGISGNSELLLVKAALDGLVAVVFAAVYGWGVGFSALSVGAMQGTFTLVGATVGASLLDDRMISELEATGGVMVVGIGVRLLDIKKIKVGSLLPALLIAPALVAIFAT